MSKSSESGASTGSQPPGNQPATKPGSTPERSTQVAPPLSVERRADGKRPIWLLGWFQTLLGVLLVFTFLWFVLPPIFNLVHASRTVLGPVLVGAVLAYVFNPLVTWMRRHWHLPRWAGTSVVMLGLVLAVGGMAAIATPVVIAQSGDLIQNLKEAYPKAVSELSDNGINSDGPSMEEDGDNESKGILRDEVQSSTNGEKSPGQSKDNGQGKPSAGHQSKDGQTAENANAKDQKNVTPADGQRRGGNTPGYPGPLAGESDPAQSGGESASYFQTVLDSDSPKEFLARISEYLSKLNWTAIGSYAGKALGIGVGIVGSVISFTTYMIVFVVVVGFSFFFLSWHLGEVKAWFVPLIPAFYRERTLELLGKMDFTVSRWVRGRLLQALLLAMMLGVGWRIVGVPYWFLLAVLGGVLGLVPYLIIFAFAVALLLATLDDVAAQQFGIWTLAGPAIVYAIAQTIDGWVVEPLLQGKATEMNAFTVLVVVLIGGTLAGLVGLLAAIPIAACIKIILAEVVLPKLRELAAGMDQAPS